MTDTDTIMQPGNLAMCLAHWADTHPERVALKFLGDGESLTEQLTFRQLNEQARQLASLLAQATGQGERAILLYPSGPGYATAFVACLYAGIIAVPAYPPESTLPQHARRLMAILEDARPTLLLTERSLADAITAMLTDASPQFPGVRVIATDALAQPAPQGWVPPVLDGAATAFLQYTSGSTAQPKGVQVTHDNLIANETAIRKSFGIASSDTIITWLPLYHDMGLIGSLLQPLFSGVTVVLMSPRHFLERPIRWLKAVSRFDGTVSGGPDFAFRLCVDRIPEEQIPELDLRSWQLAFSGSEPVRDDTLRAFAAKFAPAGFDARAFYPCYGLAEATLLVTGGRRGQGHRVLSADSAALARNEFLPASGGSRLVGAGTIQPGHALLMVDPASGQSAPRNGIGEIWLSGPSVAHGYWNNPKATRESFVVRDGRTWLRTGDLGFSQDEALFVTGRLKDMIIVRGQNIYPVDIERTIESEVELVRKGRVAAFAVEMGGREGIGVAAEISRSVRKLVSPEQIAQAISEAVAQVHLEPASVVVLLNPGGLPKTTSGKLQRSACRVLWADGEFDSYAIYENGIPKDASGPSAAPAPAIATPLNDIEMRVGGMWAEILQAPAVVADDTFLALGGSSLTAVQTAARVQEYFGIEVDMTWFFQAATLREFSLKVAARMQAGQYDKLPLERQTVGNVAPASSAQRRMWFLWQMETTSAAYNIAGSLRLRGKLDPAAVQQVLDAIAMRHGGLRSTFEEHEGELLQRIHQDGCIVMGRDDAGNVPEVQPEEAMRALVRKDASCPFDLANGPVWRARMIRVADEDHVLVVVMHHIVADGESMNVLIREFSALYDGYAGGAPPLLPELPVNYADYAAWQRQRLDAGEEARQLAYWSTELGREESALNLPLDRPRPHAQSYAGANVHFTVPPALTDRLRNFARANATTLFMVLQAGFDILLHRYSGQREIRVGVPFANRSHARIQGLVGLFVNTLVLKSEWREREGFSSFLRRARTTVLQAQMHADLPFDRLVQALRPDRSLAHTPLFQVMFNHLERDHAGLEMAGGLRLEASTEDAGITKFDLGLNTEEERGGKLQGTFVYASDLFDEATIQRLAAHYVALLDVLTAQPETDLAQVNFLPEQEVDRILEWSRGESLEQARTFAHEQVARQAGITPGAAALVFDGQTMTYEALNQRSDNLAVRLVQLGAGPDVLVGLLLDRSFDLVIAILGILKSGAAYVPLDPAYPADRIAYMVQDAGVRLIVTDAAASASLPDSRDAAVVRLDHLDLSVAPAPTGPTGPKAARRPAAENLAYVLYTSGTTGKPKGVANTHRALSQRLAWMQHEYRLGSAETLLQKTPASFDVSVWEVLWPLMHGARLAIAAPGEHRDPQRLARLIRQHQVTTIHFVPSMLSLFLEQEEAGQCNSLKRIFSGGETLTRDLQDKVLALFSAARFDNRYGPTETLINATSWTCRQDHRQGVPIGRPLPDTSIYLLDAALNLVPAGVAGHLHIGGPGLARGYVGGSAPTAEKFIPHPFASNAGERLYRSGDLARWRADGVVEYLGRDDQQVKVRGFRIEPSEIEAHLRGMDHVHEAAVAGWPGPDSSLRLVAYVALSAGGRIEDIRQELASRLPEYMVPALFMSVDHLPLMANGKLDRAMLPTPVWTTGQFVEPGTPVEQTVAGIWRDVLQVERIGLTDRFFDLGGHSLLATQVVSRVRKAFDIELPLRALFESTDLQDFARHVQASVDTGKRNRQPQPARIDRGDALPLSYSQERMWFLWNMEPDGAAYNVGGAVRLSGNLDISALRSALAALVRRHDGLRTTFPVVDGVPVQHVSPVSNVALEERDLIDLDIEERDRYLEAFAQAEAHRPFDLAAGPLIRAYLLRLEPQAHLLLVTIHHIVAEGWAMDVFADEYAQLYRDFATGREPSLSPLDIQYPDFAVWQRKWLESGEADRQLEYWKKKLGQEQPVLYLPTDYPRPAVRTFNGDSLTFDLEPALFGQVQAFNKQQGTTLFMTVAAAMLVLMHRYTGQVDLRVGYPIANRTYPEFERIIGGFLNTQVLQCDVTGAMTVNDLVREVRDAAIDAQAHQDVPFHLLVDALRPERSSAHSPLFQVMCNVQRWRFQQTREVAPGLKAEFLPNDSKTAKFDLLLDVTDINDELTCLFTYSTDLFKRETVERMARHWLLILQGMVQNPEASLGALALLGPSEAESLTRDLHSSRVPHPVDRPLHALFEDQVRTAPHAIAVSFEDEALTYGELNARANKLARKLLELEIAPDALIGIAVERSLETVIGMLAVLKAGGAYLPLDPSYPEEHLAYLIADAKPRVVLTQTHLLNTLPDSSTTWCFDKDWAQIEGYDGDNLPVRVHPQNLAYCIYTSGSTGRPKGTLITQANVVRLFKATERKFGLGSQDTWTMFHSYAFDFSVWEIFGALLYGGKVVVVPYMTSRSPEAFLELLVRERITILNQTPSAFRQLLQVPGLYARSHQLSLRHVIFGGEALDVASLKPWFDQVGDEMPRLTNMYGITETTVHVTHHRLTMEDTRKYWSPIGTAIEDLSWHVLDAALNPVPAGVIGEVYVGGPGLARGYLGHAGLTAERFLPDPFGAGPGARLYRTGDLARWRAEGAMEYLGRTDTQVKIRGFRVELGEIEGKLREQSGVKDAVVIARRDEAGHAQLVAYVVSPGKAQPADVGTLIEDLRQRLAARLPSHMIPHAFVVLDALPLTANGKLDRKSLPAPVTAASSAYVAPCNPTQETLARIWCRVLKLDRVGIEDNFFEVGGDSISAVQMATFAREEGMEITPQQLFQYQTIAALSANIATKALPEDILQEPDECVAPVADSYALTPMQEGILFHSHVEKSKGTYIIQCSCEINGSLDIAAFQDAWRHALATHDILRTSFEWDGHGQPLQRVHAAVDLPWVEMQWEDRPADEQAQDVRNMLQEDYTRDFDLGSAPLMRVTLIRLGPTRHYLIWTHHHLLMDAWSVDYLLAEVAKAYHELAAGRKLTRVEVTPFRKYVEWLNGQDRGHAAAYWKQALSGLEEPLLIRNAGMPILPGNGLGRMERTFPAAQTQALQRHAQAQRITLNTLVQGATLVALGSLSRKGQVVLGVTVAGRQAPLAGIFEMKGLFINTVPLFVELAGDRATGDWLRALQQQNLQMRNHAFLPLVDIHACSGIPRTTRLFDVIFVFENHPVGEALERDIRTLGVSSVESQHRNGYPLTIVVWPEDNMRFLLLYEQEVLDAAQAGQIFERIRLVLDAWVTGNGAHLGAIQYTEALQAASGDAIVPAFMSLHQGIEKWAAREPDAIAVVHADQTLTYRQLNAKANRLARKLIALGLKPDMLAGLMVERSLDMVVAMLAILKAGGAYLPLDPEYPANRLRYMIQDAKPAVVITQERYAAAFLNAGHRMPTWCIDRQSNELSAYDNTDLGLPTYADQLAYCIYTSGSTGRPKGALLSHHNVMRLFDVAKAHFDFDRHDVWTMFHSFTFDFSVWEIFGALLHGAKLVIVPHQDSRSPAAFLKLLARERVTVLNQTPSAFRQFMDTPGLYSALESIPLRYVIFGGEALDVGGLAPWFEHVGDERPELVNMYGITETTIHVTYRRLRSRDTNSSHSPIGLPLADLGWHVLDSDMNEVPPGFEGELYIQGPGLTRGYLGRGALTADRFVPDPYGGTPGARLYRTGDLVRQCADHSLEYRGRIDQQVKIRGFRIELGEIEARLKTLKEIRNAVVIGHGTGADMKLAAYVVPTDLTAPETIDLRAALRRQLRQMLPDYMVPATFVVMKSFPLTGNGKLDRRMLPSPDEVVVEDAEYTAPADSIEEVLEEIWCDILQVDRVSVTSHFLDVGGHSLSAVKMAAQIKIRLGVIVPLTILFELNTIRLLGTWIRQARHGDRNRESANEMHELLSELRDGG